MSIETMMTLGLAAAIFVTALLLLGMLTIVTRLTAFILRPAARGGYTLAKRYAPVARAGLVTFWERTSPAIASVGKRLGAEAAASTERAAALAASWGRRLAAEASAWSRRSAGGAVSLGKRSAAGVASVSKRSAAGATTLSERSADGVTTYVMPAVRSLFTDDEDLGLEPTFSPRRRIRHS
jgi:hypothetical protein